jgi:hypothetical protein
MRDVDFSVAINPMRLINLAEPRARMPSKPKNLRHAEQNLLFLMAIPHRPHPLFP